MDQDTFNLSLRKFLKTIGVCSQREIEQAVQAALRERALPEHDPIVAKMTLEIPALGLKVPFAGELRLK